MADLFAAAADDRRANPFYAIFGLQDHEHGLGKRQRTRLFIGTSSVTISL